MNYRQATDILDRRREGADFSEITINMALELTGDLINHDFERAQAIAVQRLLERQSVRKPW